VGGRGDLVGIVEILMETNNATTVVAIRDTEVAQIPSGLLKTILNIVILVLSHV